MSIAPIKSNKGSLVDQVEKYLLDLIRSGVYRRGEKVPTEVELANKLGVARGTLREALNKLQLAGVIERKHGLGTFIAKECDIRLQSELEKHESVLDLADKSGVHTSYTDLVVSEIPATEEIMRTLGLEPGAKVTSIERIILADGRRVAFMRDITPTDILTLADLNDGFRGSVLDLIRTKQKMQVSRAIARIEAINANLDLARKLDVELGKALIEIEETLFDKNGRPMEFSNNYFISNFFQFNVTRYYNAS